ncbi:Virulence protein [Legionella beliardensis]|uniref:Virulence protein n=1 Tax=Legionella beliardensis TaxID=91822 RepID=A0A378I0H2_9GAMM|nr:RhuM family protein [Legionella beliardensis]STX28472.1 Virulence protein [Legionella beliardensis]
MKKSVLIYTDKDNSIHTEVQLEGETVWLSQAQMVELFKKTKQNISLHINNIFKEGELDANSVVKESLTTAADGKTYKTQLYNLDVIISVGYRVKSKQGTQFRIWANNVLKEYLVRGYALDRSRLQKQEQQLLELKNTLNLFQQAQLTALNEIEANGLLSILTNYAHTFILLNQYDTGNFPAGKLNTNITCEINYASAIKAIEDLKQRLINANEATPLFGRPKDESFKGILGNIVQSFGGEYLYPSIEEQAAHLLYFIIKNHPFADGNKRIGAFMFIWFLQLNKHHLKRSGEVKINDNALVAIALLVAQSDPAQKDVMIQLIINLIRDNETNS